jgi:hypothetical protein
VLLDHGIKSPQKQAGSTHLTLSMYAQYALQEREELTKRCRDHETNIAHLRHIIEASNQPSQQPVIIKK